MKRVILTLELTLGDLSDEERAEIEASIDFGDEAEDLPRIDEYADAEVSSIMRDIFGDFGLTDPENSAEIFAGTDFYGAIAKSRVLACTVEHVDDAGSDP